MKRTFIHRKRCILLLAVVCLFLTGCDNRFAENEYHSVEKIAESEDRYAKEGSVFHSVDGGWSLVVSRFDGRQTLWTDTLEEAQNVEIEISFVLAQGQAKIVHIDAEGNVTTLIECTPETSTSGYVTTTVSMTSGQNRIKIVGFDCENIDLKMFFSING